MFTFVSRKVYTALARYQLLFVPENPSIAALFALSCCHVRYSCRTQVRHGVILISLLMCAGYN